MDVIYHGPQTGLRLGTLKEDEPSRNNITKPWLDFYRSNTTSIRLAIGDGKPDKFCEIKLDKRDAAYIIEHLAGWLADPK